MIEELDWTVIEKSDNLPEGIHNWDTVIVDDSEDSSDPYLGPADSVYWPDIDRYRLVYRFVPDDDEE